MCRHHEQAWKITELGTQEQKLISPRCEIIISMIVVIWCLFVPKICSSLRCDSYVRTAVDYAIHVLLASKVAFCWVPGQRAGPAEIIFGTHAARAGLCVASFILGKINKKMTRGWVLRIPAEFKALVTVARLHYFCLQLLWITCCFCLHSGEKPEACH